MYMSSGESGVPFLARLKIAAGRQSLHYAPGQLPWGPPPSRAWRRERGAEFRDLLH